MSLRAGLIALAVLALAAVACDKNDSSPGPAPSPAATSAREATATPASPPPTALPTRAPGDTSVTGLFADPRPAPPVQTRALGELPAPAFRPWDGVSTILYDTQTQTEMNLGPGNLGSFSPDSTKMVWVPTPASAAGAEVWMIDLTGGQKRSLGAGRTADFFDNERITSFKPASNESELINVLTGAREPIPGVNTPQAFAMLLPDGNRLRTRFKTEYPYLVKTFTVLEKDFKTLLEFEAYVARPAGPGELVVATPPVDGTTNIFILTIATGRAEFIATSRYAPPNWPVGASSGFVVWTEAYCGVNAERGRTRIFDRRTRAITEIDASLWVTMTPGDQIAAGEFGARALIDAQTLQYTLALPIRDPNAPAGGAGDVSWSSDYRYASRGAVGGHGGLCG